MTFQADDVAITVEVMSQVSGEKINASDFNQAKYEISNLSGVVLFAASYPGDITIENEEFIFTYPRELNNQVGEQRHEMRVRDSRDNESTVVQQFINNKQTRVRL